MGILQDYVRAGGGHDDEGTKLNIHKSKYRGGCGCTARLPTDNRPELARVAAAEAVGAALLVLLSCFPSCLPTPLSSTHTALASGCVVAMLVQGLDHISGAMMNPTVTLAAVVWGRVSAVRAIVMFAAQLAGGAAGAAALAALVPAGGSLAGCLTVPAPGVSTARAVAVEAVLGACLALVNCAAWDPRNQHLRDSWPLRIGTSVAAMSLVAGTLTGASMNPARSLAPAVLLGQFHHHWVYWVGPLSGGAGAAALYCALWRPPPPRAAPAPAPALPRTLSKHCTAACCSREDWRAPGGGG